MWRGKVRRGREEEGEGRREECTENILLLPLSEKGGVNIYYTGLSSLHLSLSLPSHYHPPPSIFRSTWDSLSTCCSESAGERDPLTSSPGGQDTLSASRGCFVRRWIWRWFMAQYCSMTLVISLPSFPFPLPVQAASWTWRIHIVLWKRNTKSHCTHTCTSTPLTTHMLNVTYKEDRRVCDWKCPPPSTTNQ